MKLILCTTFFHKHTWKKNPVLWLCLLFTVHISSVLMAMSACSLTNERGGKNQRSSLSEMRMTLETLYTASIIIPMMLIVCCRRTLASDASGSAKNSRRFSDFLVDAQSLLVAGCAVWGHFPIFSEQRSAYYALVLCVSFVRVCAAFSELRSSNNAPNRWIRKFDTSHCADAKMRKSQRMEWGTGGEGERKTLSENGRFMRGYHTYHIHGIASHASDNT